MIHNLLVHKGDAITSELRDSMPVRLNNPFSYIPCSLCREAAAQVQEYLAGRSEWSEELKEGKMFGVLVVETPDARLGYLAAFSGVLQGRNDWDFFVPPVYDLLLPDDFFKVGEREISSLNRRIAQMETSGRLAALKGEIAILQGRYEEEIAALKEIYARGKVERERLRRELGNMDAGRWAGDDQAAGSAGGACVGSAAGVAVGTYGDVAGAASGSGAGKREIMDRLVKESQFQKGEIRRAEKRMREVLDPLRGQLAGIEAEIGELKELRKAKSAALQEEIFRHFVFLNARGERKDLLDIFRDYYSGEAVLPPGGAGECAAPKLLQYAYLHGMRPVAMGEFWWGGAPACAGVLPVPSVVHSQVRRHGEFYPSCKNKCAPILHFMLQGLDVDPLGAHSSYGQAGSLEILYSDDHILAVNKPAGILSVPGVPGHRVQAAPGDRVTYHTSDNQENDVLKVLNFLHGFRPENLYVVHRLDMHTSGVLLLARSEQVYKELQRQFAQRKVEKRYVALLDGVVDPGKCGSGVVWDEYGVSGIINLPLIPDYDNRPAQMVDFNRGKEAVTRFRIIKVEQGRTQIEFAPVTGRTHQLRVHSAHPMGLNVPIVGDLLYGRPGKRLMLHAGYLKFTHPFRGEIELDASFDFPGEIL